MELISDGEHCKKEMRQLDGRIKDLDKKFNDYQKEVHKKFEELEKKCESWITILRRKLLGYLPKWLTGTKGKELE